MASTSSISSRGQRNMGVCKNQKPAYRSQIVGVLTIRPPTIRTPNLYKQPFRCHSDQLQTNLVSTQSPFKGAVSFFGRTSTLQEKAISESTSASTSVSTPRSISPLNGPFKGNLGLIGTFQRSSLCQTREKKKSPRSCSQNFALARSTNPKYHINI